MTARKLKPAASKHPKKQPSSRQAAVGLPGKRIKGRVPTSRKKEKSAARPATSHTPSLPVPSRKHVKPSHPTRDRVSVKSKDSPQALRERIKEFRALVETCPDFVARIDRELRFLYINRPVYNARIGRVAGRTRDLIDSIGIAQADIHAQKERIRQVFESGLPAHYESEFPSERGLRWYDTHFVPEFGTDGQVATVLAYSRDITEQKQAQDRVCQWSIELEQRVAERTAELEGANGILEREIVERARADRETVLAKEQWERTFDSMPDLIAILDTEQRIVRVNRAMAARLRAAPEKCVGLKCYETVHRLSSPPEFCPHLLTMQDRQEHLAEVHEPLLGGEFLVTTTPLFDERGVAVGSVHVARDITDRKRAEERIQRLNDDLMLRARELAIANRELERLATSMALDLRAPIVSVRNLAQLLLNDHGAELPPEARSLFKLIHANTLEMDKLTEGLLRLARISRQPLETQTVSPDGLARAAVAELSDLFQGRDVNITIHPMPVCQADPTLLKQVWFQLLSNALKFTRTRDAARIEVGFSVTELPGYKVLETSSHEAKSVESRADASNFEAVKPCNVKPGTLGPETTYYVRDNGVGFSMEYAKEIFHPFQHFHHPDEFEGVGIGLAITEGIVRRHGGRIWAESVVDEGAAFYFTLHEPLH